MKTPSEIMMKLNRRALIATLLKNYPFKHDRDFSMFPLAIDSK
jgi:hypothetical protein